ncbi:hypothetical protein U4W25_25635 (plasmid) [Citrobacter amalonaticus]|uniref:hypothetical protein n=1 Tax=Citrobacter amalonaticus TaxID=35703 RepID=UPI00292979FA|nr:hypothetical protein [Citrobacter amalonaticus]ELN9503674.1 hypothetical protein [Citrobacter amalonaticus]ELW9351138.1 hypothetical protein [Citrobacter amalonaticus]WQJ86941.1 hypothetical protein U4W25_25635 [Citrobacter amalonaticus]
MAHDVPLGCAPDEYDDLISGTCSHLPKAVLSLVEERSGNKFTGVDASKYIGLPSETGRGKGSRTFRRWCKEGGIPYAAWALLCYKAGFGVIWEADEQRGEN